MVTPDRGGPAAGQRGFLARLRRDLRGATAVEFALVSIPFLSLLFAIIETGLMFFVGQVLDGSTAEVARQIRTGQAKKLNMTSAQFKAQICDGMVNLVNCDTDLYVDVRSYATFTAADLSTPINADGTFKPLQFNIGSSGSIVVVRAFYTWPSFFHLLPTGSSLPTGDRLLGAVLAFRNEPFPW